MIALICSYYCESLDIYFRYSFAGVHCSDGTSCNPPVKAQVAITVRPTAPAASQEFLFVNLGTVRVCQICLSHADQLQTWTCSGI